MTFPTAESLRAAIEAAKRGEESFSYRPNIYIVSRETYEVLSECGVFLGMAPRLWVTGGRGY